MKRIVFCFDGTWNRLGVDTPTNVVLTAASINRQAPNSPCQIIHYDEGIGTGRLEHFSGGMFGVGLMANVREAYRFLIFNYDPGDELYIFGFSRGAWSARSFAGLIRHVGPLRRLNAGRIDEAVDLYIERNLRTPGVEDRAREFRANYSNGVCLGQADDDWRCKNLRDYQAGQAPVMTIKYLGVWDTVGALGFPDFLPFSAWLNRKKRFHDTSLSTFVESGRHAIAIDERRRLFPVTGWSNVDELNEDLGFAKDVPNAPYQQRWFPGDHGSVGGGGDITGLSDYPLAWVVDGAKKAGLLMDTSLDTRIHKFRPDANAKLVNVANPKFSFTQLIKWNRPGPKNIWEISRAALRRYHTKATGKPAYRPATLKDVFSQLDAVPADQFGPVFEGVMATHKVKPGEGLGQIAVAHYGKGNAGLSTKIFQANRDVLDSEHEIFAGQELRIPTVADLVRTT